MTPTVLSVNISKTHSFSKFPEKIVHLVKGQGIEGDAHKGEYVKHRSRVKANPKNKNLRQVHLIHQELFNELREKGYIIKPGEIGENITTQHLDILDLPKGTVLSIGSSEIELTGLRNPCNQLNDFQKGLMNELIYKNELGQIIRKCGVMGIVKKSGSIKPGDVIQVTYPPKPFQRLEKV